MSLLAQVELAAGRAAVEAWAEGTGAGVDGQCCGALPLFAQLFRGPHDVGGDRLLQFLEAGDRSAEAAADAGFLFGGGGQGEGQAGMAPELPLQAPTHHAGFGFQHTGGHVAQLTGVGDAAAAAPMGEFAADAPHVFDGDGFQPGVGVVTVPQVKHAGMGWDAPSPVGWRAWPDPCSPPVRWRSAGPGCA